MPTQGPSSHASQQSSECEKDKRERLERRRLKLERKSKRAARRAITIAEIVALKGASEMLRVVQKLNRPIRKRIQLDDD
jgi:hypothetical protein